MSITQNFPWKGYLLLPPSIVDGYQGVDRQPFVPMLVIGEMDSAAVVEAEESRISDFYAHGWRHEAYRIYEEHLVRGTSDDLDLLADLEAAKKIRDIIDVHTVKHQIFSCEIWGLDENLPRINTHDREIFGYDIAYPGGDFYSAILNGLFINPNRNFEKYKSYLNQNGLFAEVGIIHEYLERFRQHVLSEANSEFVIYELDEAS